MITRPKKDLIEIFGFASIFYENYSSLNVLLNNERIKDIEILKAAINSIKDRGKMFVGSDR